MKALKAKTEQRDRYTVAVCPVCRVQTIVTTSTGRIDQACAHLDRPSTGRPEFAYREEEG